MINVDLGFEDSFAHKIGSENLSFLVFLKVIFFYKNISKTLAEQNRATVLSGKEQTFSLFK